MEEINQVIIEEKPAPAEVTPITEETLKQSDFSPAEVEMAKKHGIIKDEKSEVKTDAKQDKKKDVTQDKKVDIKSEINPDELDSFEKIHDIYQTSPEAFYKLPKATRNLYHNSKGLYKKAKEEEEKRKDIEGKVEFNKVQDSVSRVKLDRINNRLKTNTADNPLTIEELQSILGVEKVNAILDEEKPITKKDLEAIENDRKNKEVEQNNAIRAKEETAQRNAVNAEAYARANIKEISGGKYTDINDIVSLAQEMAAAKPRYAKQINEAFTIEDFNESDAIDVIVDIAKLNPKWGQSVKTEKGDGNVERMIENSKKQNTSATVVGGKGNRVVTHDELTPEDAVKLNQDQWNKLPRQVRDRILKAAA